MEKTRKPNINVAVTGTLLDRPNNVIAALLGRREIDTSSGLYMYRTSADFSITIKRIDYGLDFTDFNQLLSELKDCMLIHVINPYEIGAESHDSMIQLGQFIRDLPEGMKNSVIFVVDILSYITNMFTFLGKVELYLKDFGIMNPRIFPVATSVAIDLRTILGAVDDSETINDYYDATCDVWQIVKIAERHLEQYAPLPPEIRVLIDQALMKAKDRGDMIEQALIHTGIVSLANAISLYAHQVMDASTAETDIESKCDSDICGQYF